MVVNSKEEFNEGILGPVIQFTNFLGAAFELESSLATIATWLQQQQPGVQYGGSDNGISSWRILVWVVCPQTSGKHSFKVEEAIPGGLSIRWRSSITANVTTHGFLGVIVCHIPRWMTWWFTTSPKSLVLRVFSYISYCWTNLRHWTSTTLVWESTQSAICWTYTTQPWPWLEHVISNV